MPALIRKNNQGSSLHENCNQSRELQAAKGWENYARRLVDSSKIEYYVTKGGDEIDFLVQDNVTKKRRLVQVTWDMSDETTFTREMKALREAMGEIESPSADGVSRCPGRPTILIVRCKTQSGGSS